MDWIGNDRDGGVVIEPVYYINRVTLGRPAPEVFDFVTTPGRWPEYHPVSRRVEPESDLSYWDGREYWPASLGPCRARAWALDQPASLQSACRELVVGGPLQRWFHWICVECARPGSVKLLGRAVEYGEVWATVAYRLDPVPGDDGATHFERIVSVLERSRLQRTLGIMGLNSVFARKWRQALDNLTTVLDRKDGKTSFLETG